VPSAPRQELAGQDLAEARNRAHRTLSDIRSGFDPERYQRGGSPGAKARYSCTSKVEAIQECISLSRFPLGLCLSKASLKVIVKTTVFSNQSL
jgi:hypothetical protein